MSFPLESDVSYASLVQSHGRTDSFVNPRILRIDQKQRIPFVHNEIDVN